MNEQLKSEIEKKLRNKVKELRKELEEKLISEIKRKLKNDKNSKQTQ